MFKSVRNFKNNHYNLIKFYNQFILPIIFTQKILNELSYIIHKKNLLFSLKCLKQHIKFQYKLLSCISGVDFFESKISSFYRFCIVYDLLSLTFNTRVKIKIFLNELSLVYSVTTVFINSNWWEREIWDMFGIWFTNHPDLRRILTDYGFDGFPLRKDFPLIGFFEISYDFKKKRIISSPCELSQEFRNFSFENVW